jgi:hypothetical protein
MHLSLVFAEYALLFVASILTLQELASAWTYGGYAAVFFALIGVLLTRTFMRPQQDWYRSRALAESVKTLSWRYMMRAEPFAGVAADQAARAELRNQLNRILTQDRAAAERLVPHASGDNQITGEMDRIRDLSLDKRRKLYERDRVDDQRAWYAKKAAWNRSSGTRWVVVGVAAYSLAALLILARMSVVGWQIWPIEPIIVFATAVVGWTQLKKFSELAAAYSITAHEIGLIRIDLDAADTDEKFSQFVNDAERAFSREHTLWLARQTE